MVACTAGPTLKFHAPAVVALAGAEFSAHLDGKDIPCWTSVAVSPGSTLTVGSVTRPSQTLEDC